MESFEDLTIEATEVVDAGDKVVVALFQRGRPRGSQTAVEGRWWQVTTLRGGQIARSETFQERAQALEAAGLPVPVVPDGAFYAWADCTQMAQALGVSGSWDFAFELMKRAHLAITPGRDFGSAETSRFVRFSTASSMAHLEEAIARLRAL